MIIEAIKQCTTRSTKKLYKIALKRPEATRRLSCNSSCIHRLNYYFNIYSMNLRPRKRWLLGLLVSRIGCHCKSYHANFVCAYARKFTSFNSVFIQQIRVTLIITCVWIFFIFLNTEFPRYKYLLFQPTEHLPSKWGQNSKTLESFRVCETRDAAITLANGLQRSVSDFFPSAKSDTPLMTIHSTSRSWAATKRPRRKAFFGL